MAIYCVQALFFKATTLWIQALEHDQALRSSGLIKLETNIRLKPDQALQNATCRLLGLMYHH